MTTPVLFRKIVKDGAIIAFFPATLNHRMRLMSYMHVGQHGEAHINFLRDNTREATPDEYKALLKELKGQEYDDLKITE
jgi:hypothetical protein